MARVCLNMAMVLWLGVLLAPAWAAAPSPLTITEENTGQNLTLKVGQKLVVNLRHPGDGGFDVLPPQQNKSVLGLVGQRRLPPADPRRMGDFGRMIYEFKALKEGQTDLVVPIKRPWEKQTLDYLKVKIRVAP